MIKRNVLYAALRQARVIRHGIPARFRGAFVTFAFEGYSRKAVYRLFLEPEVEVAIAGTMKEALEVFMSALSATEEKLEDFTTEAERLTQTDGRFRYVSRCIRSHNAHNVPTYGISTLPSPDGFDVYTTRGIA